MKRIVSYTQSSFQFLIFTTLILFTYTSVAQSAARYYKQGKLTQAKEVIDKEAINSAENWYLKANIYGKLFLKNDQYEYGKVAYSSLLKYVEQCDKSGDTDYRLFTLEERKPIISLYANFSRLAAKHYNAAAYVSALEGFETAVEIFGFMQSKNWTGGINFDTLTVLYAGICAEKAQLLAKAALYYGMVAERRCSSEAYDRIYQWLIEYYRSRGEEENAKKFATLGAQAFPAMNWQTPSELPLNETTPAATARKEITGFLGVPFGTPKKETISSLLRKGGAILRENEKYITFGGLSIGPYPARSVMVAFHKDSLCFALITIEPEKKPQAIDIFGEIRNNLIVNYGSTVTSTRHFKYPYSDTPDDWQVAIEGGYATIRDEWKDNKGIVSLSITIDMEVLLTYNPVSELFREYLRSQNNTDDF